MTKIEYRKTYKNLYLPKATPSIVDVPEMSFFQITGEGSPDHVNFEQAVEALYTLSYSVKMSYKKEPVPSGYYEYTVFPLEGIWDLLDYSKPSTDRDNFKYTLMIRQPAFLTNQLADKFIQETMAKKKNPRLVDVTFTSHHEGLSVQMMHIGPYRDEPISFALMENFCAENGHQRAEKRHREIYLSDPRKVAEDKMKTVLRFRVDKLIAQ